MYYEINVSFNGKHFFATAERSILTLDKAKELFALFTHKFPSECGFSVSCIEYKKVGKILELNHD